MRPFVQARNRFACCAIALVGLLIACTPQQSAGAQALPEGLPSLEQPWSVADYPRAAAILVPLSNAQLPRSSDAEGARLIQRMTSPDALAFCADQTKPLPDRMKTCLAAGDASNAILRRYLTAVQQDRAFADDLLRMQGLLLRYAEVMTGLAAEFMATIPRNEPSYETRLDGVRRMRQGFAQMLQGSAMSLQERGLYSETMRGSFAVKLAHAFQRIGPELSQEDRAPIVSLLRRIAATDRNASVRSALSGVVGAY